MSQLVQSTPVRKKMANKFIAGIAAFVATGIITASGFAGAAPMSQSNASPNEQECKKAGFSSLVLCKQAFDKDKDKNGNNGSNGSNGNGGGLVGSADANVSGNTRGDSGAMAHATGYGYGGNTSVATNIDLTLNNSNHNIIQVIVNVFR